MEKPEQSTPEKKRKHEKRTTLRLPDELLRKIEAEAANQHRSKHNLMVSILWDYFNY